MKKIISILVVTMLICVSFTTTFAIDPKDVGGVTVLGSNAKMTMDVVETETDVTATIKLSGEMNFTGIAFVVLFPSNKVQLLDRAAGGTRKDRLFNDTNYPTGTTTAAADLTGFANLMSTGYLRTADAFEIWDDGLGDMKTLKFYEVLGTTASTSYYQLAGSIDKSTISDTNVGRFTVAQTAIVPAGGDEDPTIKIPNGTDATYAIIKFKKIVSGTDVLENEIRLATDSGVSPKFSYYNASGVTEFKMSDADLGTNVFKTTMSVDWKPQASNIKVTNAQLKALVPVVKQAATVTDETITGLVNTANPTLMLASDSTVVADVVWTVKTTSQTSIVYEATTINWKEGYEAADGFTAPTLTVERDAKKGYDDDDQGENDDFDGQQKTPADLTGNAFTFNGTVFEVPSTTECGLEVTTPNLKVIDFYAKDANNNQQALRGGKFAIVLSNFDQVKVGGVYSIKAYYVDGGNRGYFDDGAITTITVTK